MLYGGKPPVLRRVVGEEVAAGEVGFKMYTLECGHVMRRRAKAARYKVSCTACTREAPVLGVGEVKVIRIPLGADERDYLPPELLD